MSTDVVDVVVVGAGLAGLATARHLHASGVETAVIESGARVGGRLATRAVDGFLIDEGFPLFHTAAPECQAMLNLDQLDLGRFAAGVSLRADGALHRLLPGLGTLDGIDRIPEELATQADLATLGQRLRRLAATPADRLASGCDRMMTEAYAESGISKAAITGLMSRYLAAFASDAGSDISAHAADLMLRQLARGRWAVPRAGIAEIPRQLAARLPIDCVRLGVSATSVSADRVVTAGGYDIRARAVVIATDPSTALRLLPGLHEPTMRTVTTFHHAVAASGHAPAAGSAVIVDGDDDSPVARTAMVTAAAPSYAPKGMDLVATNVAGGAGASLAVLERRVRERLSVLYGAPTGAWLPIAAREWVHAVPAMTTPHNSRRPVRLLGGLYVAGDHRETSTIDGALASGRRAAHALLGDLGIDPVPVTVLPWGRPQTPTRRDEDRVCLGAG